MVSAHTRSLRHTFTMTDFKAVNDCDSDLYGCCTAAGVCDSDLAACCEFTSGEFGTCDVCDARYHVSSRDGRCGDCGNCADHCTHPISEI